MKIICMEDKTELMISAATFARARGADGSERRLAKRHIS